jgi:hypothetical protein
MSDRPIAFRRVSYLERPASSPLLTFTRRAEPERIAKLRAWRSEGLSSHAA